MSDHLVRGIFQSEGLRFVACDTTKLCQNAAKKHQCPKLAAMTLGRALTAAALLGATLKSEERLGIQFSGSGPLQKLFVEIDAKGNLRGYISTPEVLENFPKDISTLTEALGERGFVNVIREQSDGEFYRGLTQMISGTIDRDLENYLTVSEQIPSILALGVITLADQEIKTAGGILLQAMPGADTELLEKSREFVQSSSLETFLAKNSSADAKVLSQTLLSSVSEKVDFLGEPTPLYWSCPCSRTRATRTLSSLGPLLLDEMIQESQKAEVICEFCKNAYQFSLDELLTLKSQFIPKGEA